MKRLSRWILRVIFFAVLAQAPLIMSSSSSHAAPWAKRRRVHSERRDALQSLLHEGFISNAGLSRLLNKLQATDVSVDICRDEVNAAYRARFETFRVSETFQLSDGTEWEDACA